MNSLFLSCLNSSARNKWTSHDIQNELLQMMANSVVRNIIKRINDSGFFTVIADESTDVSGKQQLSICLRYVTMKFKVVENFVGLYAVGKADAAHLTALLLDCFTRLNLDVHMLRGQGYDGAAVMSGARTGIAVQIAEKKAQAVYSPGQKYPDTAQNLCFRKIVYLFLTFAVWSAWATFGLLCYHTGRR